MNKLLKIYKNIKNKNNVDIKNIPEDFVYIYKYFNLEKNENNKNIYMSNLYKLFNILNKDNKELFNDKNKYLVFEKLLMNYNNSFKKIYKEDGLKIFNYEKGIEQFINYFNELIKKGIKENNLDIDFFESYLKNDNKQKINKDIVDF